MDQLPRSQHHIKENVILLLVRILVMVGLIELTYLAALLPILSSDLGEYRNIFSTLVVGGYFVRGGIEMILIIRLIIRWTTTSYYLSETQLVKHSGVLRVDEEVYDLTNLRGVHRHQSWFSKRLNYGTLHLDLAYFGYNKKISLCGIRNPKKYQRLLEAYLLKNHTTKSSPENPGERSTE